MRGFTHQPGLISSSRRGSQTKHSMGARSADNLTYVWNRFTHQVISCDLASADRLGVFLFEVVTSRNIYLSEKGTL